MLEDRLLTAVPFEYKRHFSVRLSGHYGPFSPRIRASPDQSTEN